MIVPSGKIHRQIMLIKRVHGLGRVLAGRKADLERVVGR